MAFRPFSHIAEHFAATNGFKSGKEGQKMSMVFSYEELRLQIDTENGRLTISSHRGPRLGMIGRNFAAQPSRSGVLKSQIASFQSYQKRRTLRNPPFPTCLNSSCAVPRLALSFLKLTAYHVFRLRCFGVVVYIVTMGSHHELGVGKQSCSLHHRRHGCNRHGCRGCVLLF